MQDGAVAEPDAEEGTAEEGVVLGDSLVVVLDVGADSLDEQDVIDDLDEGQEEQDSDEIPQEVEVTRHTASVVLEVLGDVAAWPLAVLQFFKAVATGTFRSLGVVYARLGAVEVQLGKRNIGRPLERLILGNVGHCWYSLDYKSYIMNDKERQNNAKWGGSDQQNWIISSGWSSSCL